MVRVNIDILGISELKWTGMGKFNSDDHYIYYFGQESLRRNGVALMVKKKNPKCSTWVQSQKWHNDLCSFPRQAMQYHSNPSLCPNQYCWSSEFEQFYEDLQELLELTYKKDVLFITGDWNAKVGSQRDTWSNRQVWPWSTKQSRAKAYRVLQENALVIANTFSNNTRDDSTHGHHQMVDT